MEQVEGVKHCRATKGFFCCSPVKRENGKTMEIALESVSSFSTGHARTPESVYNAR